ncbi:hypothetical protein B0T21DRAFT_101563 [Apiosordaria backusii]|uniref:Uncharacterized protein n=1 Tax=Apiosordaria backusii TaxID=314023 RepID=A0AA40ETS6_9PEZI|nr:hypothetical protein B0T21DRAFT_101563 [Apiosordaria backusii]
MHLFSSIKVCPHPAFVVDQQGTPQCLSLESCLADGSIPFPVHPLTLIRSLSWLIASYLFICDLGSFPSAHVSPSHHLQLVFSVIPHSHMINKKDQHKQPQHHHHDHHHELVGIPPTIRQTTSFIHTLHPHRHRLHKSHPTHQLGSPLTDKLHSSHKRLTKIGHFIRPYINPFFISSYHPLILSTATNPS